MNIKSYIKTNKSRDLESPGRQQKKASKISWETNIHHSKHKNRIRPLPMRPIFIPERARARRADCAPGPGVFVLFPPVARSLICRAVIPSSCHKRMKNQSSS